jgi:oligopeptide transport system permease protein
MARIVRGQTLSIRRQEYIEAAIASGAGTGPHHLRPCAAQRHRRGHRVCHAHGAADYLVREFLEFLGLGIQEPHASLGTLIAEGAGEMEAAPWILLVPGIFLALLLLCLNIFGDGLRDAFDAKEH